MNIHDAAKYVSEGLLVRRSSWQPHQYLGIDNCGLYVAAPPNIQVHFVISIHELLATDWEIYGSHQARGTLSLKKR